MNIPPLLTLCFAAVITTTSAMTFADNIDPATGDGYVQIQRKLQCSLRDNDPQVYRWFGKGYARVPGERDRHLFNLDGMNVRQCVTIEDDALGTGYRMVSREIMLYLDPKTNEVLRRFDNPWTGESNEVIHVANDPVNGRPTFGQLPDGTQRSVELNDINGQYLLPLEVPLFYHNPLGGDYQQYVGGTYHATEIFDFNGDTAELLDAEKDVAYPVVSWVRLAQWLPWMEMGGRHGLLYFNAMGRKLESFDQLSDTMQAEIAANYPDYTAPPPVDDRRPNETSWTYMKKIIDQRD